MADSGGLTALLPAAGAPRDLEKGETLFLQGDRAVAVFSVVRGRLRLVRHAADGASVTLHVARAGETFAEAALFSRVYHCDAVAETAARVLVHPKPAALDVLRRDAKRAKQFMAALAAQVIRLRAQLELRNIRSARERVLQYLALAIGPGGRDLVLDRPLKDLAREIGLSHEAFYRVLRDLERDGLIARREKTIRLTAPENI